LNHCLREFGRFHFRAQEKRAHGIGVSHLESIVQSSGHANLRIRQTTRTALLNSWTAIGWRFAPLITSARLLEACVSDSLIVKMGVLFVKTPLQSDSGLITLHGKATFPFAAERPIWNFAKP
jgi:hypothetical protein